MTPKIEEIPTEIMVEDLDKLFLWTDNLSESHTPSSSHYPIEYGINGPTGQPPLLLKVWTPGIPNEGHIKYIVHEDSLPVLLARPMSQIPLTYRPSVCSCMGHFVK